MDWKQVHARLVELAELRGALDFDEARHMLLAWDLQVHQRLGCASFVEYLERVFGYTPRQASERLRVARALLDLPTTREALRDGVLSWTAVRELTRVATATTERAWLDAATNKTVRQIERLVSGRQLGDLPTDPADDSAKRHVLRFEVNAETFALMRDVQAKLRDETGAMLDDDALVMEMARRVLAGPTDAGRASYQVATTVCARCERGWQDGGGETIAVDAVAVETARCDAQHVGATHVGRGRRATQTIPPATRRLVLRRDHGRCRVPGCRSTRFLDVHHVRPRADGGGHEPGNLVTLCGGHHRAVHEGRLLIDRVDEALRFGHADGRVYGRLPDVEISDLFAKAFAALRQLGFGHSEATAAVARARRCVGPEDDLEGVIREALRAAPTTGDDGGRVNAAV